MLKLIGCAVVMVSGALLGESAAQSCIHQVRLHEMILRMYKETAIVLENSYMTFVEIVDFLSSSQRYNEFDFLLVDKNSLKTKEALLNALKEWNTLKSDDSKDNLYFFFDSLGTTDIQGQVSYARLALHCEEEIFFSVKERLFQRARLSRILGVLGGVLAAIILV